MLTTSPIGGAGDLAAGLGQLGDSRLQLRNPLLQRLLVGVRCLELRLQAGVGVGQVLDLQQGVAFRAFSV